MKNTLIKYTVVAAFISLVIFTEAGRSAAQLFLPVLGFAALVAAVCVISILLHNPKTK